MTEPKTRRFFIPWVPKPATMKKIGKLHIRIYRATGGLIGTRADGLDIFLLTTLGRKSGIERTVAIPYFRRDGKLLTIASYGGNKKNPAWYLNLVSTPEVEVQIGKRVFKAQARTAEGHERTQLWDSVAAEHPRFKRYLKWCGERVIPVVVLDELPQ